jgi:hypothetical protein
MIISDTDMVDANYHRANVGDVKNIDNLIDSSKMEGVRSPYF